MNEFETRPADWLAYDEAVARILEHATPLATEEVPLDRSVGRALAIDLVAPRALPEHDNSAMDGYAVRAEDMEAASDEAPVLLNVVGESLPGSPFSASVGPGQAVRIMTGAPVPSGADSVVRVEHTAPADESRVAIRSARDARHNVRPAGEDMAAGDVVAARGTTLSPGHVAILASAGHVDVPVHVVPEMAVLSTGDELLSVEALRSVAGDPEALGRLWKNRIVDSNTPTLHACGVEAGALVSSAGIALDTRESLRDLLAGVGRADVLVTTGGASMGTHDLLKRVMDEAGFRQEFWRVRIRPGSPVSFGFLPRPGGADLPVFGLPGNPASAFVTFEIFVRPFVRALAGHKEVLRPTVQAVADTEFRGPEDLTVFNRVSLDWHEPRPRATLTGAQGSGLVSSLGLADGLAVVPDGTAVIEAGDPVQVLLIRAP